MHDDAPGIPPAAKAGQPPPLTEAELSRIAREAVHQPADARLDKQLARMGLIDPAEATGAQPAQSASRAVATDPELERLREALRRSTMALRLSVGIIAVLAVVIVVLLIR